MLNRLTAGLAFPEGPAFAPDGSLWVVELRGARVTRVGHEGALSLTIDATPNGLAIDKEGRLIICDAGGGRLLRLDGIETAVLVEGCEQCRLDRPNDLAFDSAGNLIFTCPGDSRDRPSGDLWVLKAHGGLARLPHKLQFPNGLAFSPDGRWLYVAETYRRRLWRGSWDPVRCRWNDPEPFANVGGAVGPDGLAVAADGIIYAAIYGDGVVRAVDDNGVIVASYRLPGLNPTNCAFDPVGTWGLVVTEAERGEVWSLPDLGPGAPLGGIMGGSR